ncbi:MAG: UDP-N-acetylmuramoyl-L-alanine--D-glutamate ligase [Nitrospiraceae bacterium]|nr:MAG: UDP-N-acetylmuramoyl-L-alanine--D-glutamate ligase [Nitrospiraceae bacterium]
MTVKEKNMTFRDKNIVVVGLARSGVGAANLLTTLGARVTVTDSKPESSLGEQITRLRPSIRVITGDNPQEAFSSADVVVISPGVPASAPFLVSASLKGVPIIGELELAYQAIKGMGHGSLGQRQGSFISITGTNGKSTTTTLVDLMLKEANFSTLLGGNIGIALTEEILKFVGTDSQLAHPSPVTHYPLPDYIVTEVSSFQLETIDEFRPNIAAILNITPDHLDRYKNMEEYTDAKARIFENQTCEDFLILNAEDEALMNLERGKLHVKSERPNILYFSRAKEVKGAYYKDGRIYFDLPDLGMDPSAFSLQPSTFRIQGAHNIENVMAASLAAFLAGGSPGSVTKALASFPGLEHRMEFAGEVRGVRFINDSKGTNIGAVLKSLEGFDRVILIMGGLDKGSDFSVLRDIVSKRVKALILVGKASGKIAEALGDVTETVIAADLKDAVELSLAKASQGDTVLLSPGCASFDMFQDFEDRGRQFKQAVALIQDTESRDRT